MGMYTELNFNAALKENTPPEVIEILKYMVGDSEIKPQLLPDHPLFLTERWSKMLIMDSYYFDAKTHSTLYRDDDIGTCYLCIQCNLKNYDSEIEKFIDWIKPYLNKIRGDFLGFYRYEETETPTLIYM